MNSLVYQCCFCGEKISDTAEKFNALDPCSVVLIANWTEHESSQVKQQFFSHLDCFKDKLCSAVPVYVEELAAR